MHATWAWTVVQAVNTTINMPISWLGLPFTEVGQGMDADIYSCDIYLIYIGFSDALLG